MIDVDLRRDEHLSVVRNCRRLLEIEPFREETYRTLIMTHARLGHLSQARQWYEICRSRMRNALQIDVDPATTQLFQQAMRGEIGTCRPQVGRASSAV